MTSREAFEAHILRTTGERPFLVGGAYNNVGWRKDCELWQAAIQHARNVAERCRSATTTYGETPISLAHDLGVSDCADAIKEALK